MGIAAVEFRVRIGLFNASSVCMKGASHSPLGCPLLLLQLLPAMCLYTILLIGGIESNPGPLHFQCKYCQLTMSSVAMYYQHLKLHVFRKNFKMMCCVQGCQRQLASLNSLYSHISKYHAGDSGSMGVSHCGNISCPVSTCQKDLTSRKIYLQHMVNDHLKNGETFDCPLSSCGKRQVTVPKFRTHMSRYHPLDHAVFSSEAGAAAAAAVGAEPAFASTSSHQEEDLGFDLDAVMSEDFDPASSDPYPEYAVKNEIARFYLKLEGEFLLPTTSVQAISEGIKLLSELSHYSLKKALHEELTSIGSLDDDTITNVLNKAFKRDPVFNMHHKREDVEQVSTHHLRQQYWKKNFPFVEPKEFYLGTDENGKKRLAHYVPIRETLTSLLRDDKVKELIKQSFCDRGEADNVFRDFTDGSAFKNHKSQHNGGKCLQILLFQDGFEFNPFGPAKGVYKPVGFYYTLGNLPAEYRSRVDLIQLAYMILEKDLKASQQEDFDDHDKLKASLKPLLDELTDLKTNGINIDGENIPVCLLFCIGDSLGQHQIGGFVTSFSAEFTCRFCPISKTQFLSDPTASLPLRSPSDYDNAVSITKRKWVSVRRKSIAQEKRRLRLSKRNTEKVTARTSAPGTKAIFRGLISKSTYLRLRSFNYQGIKYRPSPFNSEALDFHVCSPALPPCLAHDLFEGIVKNILAKILKYFIDFKKWFDLTLLNRRIKAFKCKGSDARDAPTPLKSLSELSGNASENWNLLRLLPFIIGDLIPDKEDPMWELYLSLKTICEFVCAPTISLVQVAYLKSLIGSFLNDVKKLEDHLPSCMTPKLHYISHYPDLIAIFGPLIRLFTLRYESKHMFFKKVARACKNYINITHTLAWKYMARFAYDHSSEILAADVITKSASSVRLNFANIPQDMQAAFPDNYLLDDVESFDTITVKGVEYKKDYFLVLSSEGVDLTVGRIELILLTSSNVVLFVLTKHFATNSCQGYYSLKEFSPKVYSLKTLESLPDYYPLPAYEHLGQNCLSLKHSIVCME